MPTRVCLFSYFDPTHRIRPHVLHYVAALRDCGFHVVVAGSGSRVPPLEDREALREAGGLFRPRANRGLDFGAWGHLIGEGHADHADSILLANDSVFGPFWDLRPIVARMDARKLDIWGMIESRETGWHLQSWFLHFTRAAFDSAPVKAVFSQNFARMGKQEIIARGEIGLGTAIRAHGLRAGAVAPLRRTVLASRMQPTNPMHIDWCHLVRSRRVPFIKSEVLRDNPLRIPWAPEWPRVLAACAYDPAWISDYLHAYTGRDAPPGTPYRTPYKPLPTDYLLRYALLSRDKRPALRHLLMGLRGLPQPQPDPA